MIPLRSSRGRAATRSWSIGAADGCTSRARTRSVLGLPGPARVSGVCISLPDHRRLFRAVCADHSNLRQRLPGIAGATVWYVLVFGALYVMLRTRYDRPFWRSLGWHFPFRGMAVTLFGGPILAFGVALPRLMLRTPDVPTPFRPDAGDRPTLILFAHLRRHRRTAVRRTRLSRLPDAAAGALVRRSGRAFLVPAAFFGALHAARVRVVMASCRCSSPLAGSAFGWVRHISGSTAASTFMHSAYNLTQFAAFLGQKEPIMIETIQWTDAGVVMIDQTRLPREESYVTCTHLRASGRRHPLHDHSRRARHRRRCRHGHRAGHAGKPNPPPSSRQSARPWPRTRPTAVNLFWAIERMSSSTGSCAGRPIEEIRARADRRSAARSAWKTSPSTKHRPQRRAADSGWQDRSHPLQRGRAGHCGLRHRARRDSRGRRVRQKDRRLRRRNAALSCKARGSPFGNCSRTASPPR